MNPIRHTNSFCPECYRELPAIVGIENGSVIMFKGCPVHGRFRSLVERSASFYESIYSRPSRTIYDGYLVDVTRRCNLRCEYCYYPLEAHDPEGMFTIESVLSDCAANAHLQPFVLTGGEPTLRKDIVELVDKVTQLGKTEMLTNGVDLAEPEFFDQLAPALTWSDSGVTAIHLSVHPETDKWIKTLALVKERGLILGSLLIVVDSKQEFMDALEICKRCEDLALCFRIKAASRIWNEQKPKQKIFVSDMLSWLDGYEIITDRDNKSVFVNVRWNGLWLMLVSWHDVFNVDLHDIACPPYYRARNGQVANFVTAGLINEGMQKGFLNGQRIPHVKTFEELNAEALESQLSGRGMP